MKLDRVTDAGQTSSVTRKQPVQNRDQSAEPAESFSLSSAPFSISYTLPTPTAWKPVRVETGTAEAAIPLLDDGPGVGGGYVNSYNLAAPMPGGCDGLLWNTSDSARPQDGPRETRTTGDDDGPGLGGGYFTRSYQATAHGALFEEFAAPEPAPDTGRAEPAVAAEATDQPEKSAASAPGQEAAPTEGPSLFQGVSLLEQMQAKISADPVAAQRLELKAVEHYEKQFAELKTPAQFRSQTERLRGLAKDGTALEELRPQAYALARVAAKNVLGKRPFDSQMLGALSMDSGTIAQMGTGEGKTLTALMPLYLNALTGQGSHLITVNDYLAQAGYDELKPAFEMLGLSSGIVLKDMSPEEKRAGYQADVTYLSNDTLGFDYLGDRTVRNAADRVQREPHFALLDEVDQVLLDEARVPLIIAGPQPQEEFQESVVQGQLFEKVVRDLVPGQDFRTERKLHSAYLTDVGQNVVANEVALLELAQDDPDYARKQQLGVQIRGLLREEAKLTEGENDLSPELRTQRGLKKAWRELLGQPVTSPAAQRLDEVRAEREKLQTEFPGVDLYAEEQMPRLRYLQNALEARALFREGVDYAVENGEVQIVDEFKGRISEGRRFTQGLHQALEIKEGLDPQPETQTLASITYPNLFRRYERLAGMTGTAKSAEKEFTEVLGLTVVEVPPNKERQRVDHPTQIYASQEEKFAAVAADVQALFEEGVPVLVATRSVEMNQYVSALLDSQGVPNQSLNAQDVKTNTPEENAIISTAGKSGVVTVATNMAGRGVDIKPDPINYKKLAIACDEARRNGEPVLVQLDKPEEAQRLIEWFQLPPDPADHVPFQQGGDPKPGSVTIQVGDGAATDGAKLLRAADFPGKKLVVLATERNLDERVDDQLRGRAGRQGAPGETRFYVSVDDDLLRIYAGEDQEKLKKTLAGSGGQEKLRKLVDAAQKRVENTQADGRLQTAKYDQVANRQREVVWSFRDQWVNSRPDAAQTSTEDTMDISATVTDWMVEAYTAAVDKELAGKSRPSQEKLDAALAVVSQEFGFPLEVEAGSGWKDKLDKGLRAKLGGLEEDIQSHLRPDMSKSMLSFYQWQSLLESLDQGWVSQLQVLEDEKQGSNLEAYAGREPEQAYIERSFNAFDEMWKWVKAETARKVMPQMIEAAGLLTKPARNPA